MPSNPVRWFEIYVQDMSRAKKFYESVFEVKLERITTDELELWGFPSSKEGYGCSGALAKMEGCASGGNSTMIYFGCADCAIEAAKVEQFGGRIEQTKKSIGQYGFIAFFYDTEGNMVGLHSME